MSDLIHLNYQIYQTSEQVREAAFWERANQFNKFKLLSNPLWCLKTLPCHIKVIEDVATSLKITTTHRASNPEEEPHSKKTIRSGRLVKTILWEVHFTTKVANKVQDKARRSRLPNARKQSSITQKIHAPLTKESVEHMNTWTHTCINILNTKTDDIHHEKVKIIYIDIFKKKDFFGLLLITVLLYQIRKYKQSKNYNLIIIFMILLTKLC